MKKEFKHEIKIYYEDTDVGGVVYYANYLKFLERARTEAIISLGFSNKKLLDKYESFSQTHPMTETLKLGLQTAEPPRRRGGWRRRAAERAL